MPSKTFVVRQAGARDMLYEKLQSIEEEEEEEEDDHDNGSSIDCIYILMGNPTNNCFQ
jgi:hypothetical protein